MTEFHFKQDAKSIVDLLFDSKLFKEEITREMMNDLETHIGDMFKSRFDFYIKITEFRQRMKPKGNSIDINKLNS
jgi:hypothetical protein